LYVTHKSTYGQEFNILHANLEIAIYKYFVSSHQPADANLEGLLGCELSKPFASTKLQEMCSLEKPV